MDMNVEVDPKLSAGIILSLFLAFGLSLHIFDKNARYLVSTFFLERTPDGILSAQMDDRLVHIDKGEVIKSYTLSNFYAPRLMGNISYFNDGEILIRQGASERGLDDFLTLSESTPYKLKKTKNKFRE